ncbi:hypothetical protein [Desnuesiella massiliensis]|uniref:hypothetical protein n=1 Tax=Desnuesiella massiliensis TaxID=1650662 RepID=UPI0006E3F0BF|nr:hypothetical protein [Desnuesiella massiliensis]
MFFNKKNNDLENLRFRYDDELEDKEKIELKHNKSKSSKEKIPFKDIFAMIIAQYAIMIPIMLGACVVFGLLLFIIVKVLMRG